MCRTQKLRTSRMASRFSWGYPSHGRPCQFRHCVPSRACPPSCTCCKCGRTSPWLCAGRPNCASGRTGRGSRAWRRSAKCRSWAKHRSLGSLGSLGLVSRPWAGRVAACWRRVDEPPIPDDRDFRLARSPQSGVPEPPVPPVPPGGRGRSTSEHAVGSVGFGWVRLGSVESDGCQACTLAGFGGV